MLRACPECTGNVSTMAVSCPHCGYPFMQSPTYKPSLKRMRLPNGFGQISEIKNKRLREPFRACVSCGKYPNGRPIVKPLKPKTYFKTYNDAYQALMEYHQNPLSMPTDITLGQLYDRWSVKHFEKLRAEGSKTNIRLAWGYCSEIHNMPAKDVRARHIRALIEESENIPKSYRHIIKSVFDMMYDYAVEYELVPRNYARDFTAVHAATEKGHINYTDEELEKLWANITIPGVKMVLIQCYSGWRPQELCAMKLSDVNVEEMSFTGGMKTEAGIGRTVPIHSRIQEFVKAAYEEAKIRESVFLFDTDYHKYNYMLKGIIHKLDLNEAHRPHDARVQFVTMAKKAGADEYAIKRIVGHSIRDITESVYTKRDLEWLRIEIEKIR